MGLESATYISQLVATNPLSTDQEAQGDDHLRLIKAALQACFPNADKAFRFPTAVAKSANYSVLSSDDNTLFYIDTSGGAVSLTLPTLASGDKGWGIRVVKTTTDANPVFVVPPSGTVNGYSKVRRSVEFLPFAILWTGSNFFTTRQFGVPIGARIPFHGTSLPNGTLWPDGTTFTAANFVELNTILGGNTKPDTRGRFGAGKSNMGDLDAGRITTAGSSIDGTTLGSVGGAENVTIARNQLPNVDFMADGAGSLPTASSSQSGGSSGQAQFGTGQTAVVSPTPVVVTLGGHIYLNGNVTQTTVNKMPPTFIQNEVLVAE